MKISVIARIENAATSLYSGTPWFGIICHCVSIRPIINPPITAPGNEPMPPSTAAVAGSMYVLQYGVVSFSDGFLPGVKAFTAAVLSGIG